MKIFVRFKTMKEFEKTILLRKLDNLESLWKIKTFHQDVTKIEAKKIKYSKWLENDFEKLCA